MLGLTSSKESCSCKQIVSLNYCTNGLTNADNAEQRIDRVLVSIATLPDMIIIDMRLKRPLHC